MKQNISSSLDRKLKEFPWLWGVLDDWDQNRVEVKVANFPSADVSFEIKVPIEIYAFASDRDRRALKHLIFMGPVGEDNVHLLSVLLIKALNYNPLWLKKKLKYFCLLEKGNTKRKHVITIFRPPKIWEGL